MHLADTFYTVCKGRPPRERERGIERERGEVEVRGRAIGIPICAMATLPFPSRPFPSLLFPSLLFPSLPLPWQRPGPQMISQDKASELGALSLHTLFCRGRPQSSSKIRSRLNTWEGHRSESLSPIPCTHIHKSAEIITSVLPRTF